MADTFVKCRCGRRIPNDWKRCMECRRFYIEDGLRDGLLDRMERAQCIRVALKLGLPIAQRPAPDPEIVDALLEGIVKRSREHETLQWRRERKALAHIQVLQANIRLRNLDIADIEA